MKILLREKEAEKNKNATEEELWNFREKKKKKEERVEFNKLLEEQELVEIGEEGFDDLEVGDLMSELGLSTTSEDIEIEYEEMLGDELDEFNDPTNNEDFMLSSIAEAGKEFGDEGDQEIDDMDSDDIINNFVAILEDEKEKRKKEKEM